MASRHHNITVDIGADYNANVFAYANGSATTPLNLSAYPESSSNGIVSKGYFYNPGKAATFNIYFIDATAGIVNLVLDRANTSSLSPGKYVYDVVVYNPNKDEKTRILEGILTARAGVSS